MSLHLFVDSDIRKVLRDIDKVDQRCKDLTRNPVKIKLQVEGLGALDGALRSLSGALRLVSGDLSRISAGINLLNGGTGAINNLAGAARGAGGGIGGMTRSMLGFAATITGVNLVSDAIGFLRDSTLGFSALLETTMVGFDTILRGNTEAAKDLMDQLKSFAIPTPFEMPDLAPLAQQVMAFNLVQKDAADLGKQVTDVLRDVGDASFGLGRGQPGVDRLVLALGQMMTATRVTGNDMLQLQSVGVNAWAYLAEATGKTTGEVRKLVSKGLVPAKEGIEAIRAGMRKDFGGAMEKAAHTWSGAISSIRDIARQKLSNLFAPAFESMSEFAQKAGQVLQSREFDRWVEEFTGKVSTAFAYVTGIYDGFVEEVRQNNPVLLALLAILGARFIWLANVAIGRAMYSAGFAIGQFVASVPPQFLLAVAAVTAFALAYKSNFLGIKTMTDSVVNFVVDGVKTLSWGLAKAVEWATEHIPGLKSLLGDQTGLADGVMQDFENFDQTAAKWKQNLAETFSIDGIGKQVKASLGALLPDINKALSEAAAKSPKSILGKVAMPHIDIAGNDSDAKKKRLAQERAALKILKDQLGDNATAWADYAKSVAKSAEDQIAKIADLRKDLQDFFGFVQEKFVALGVIDNPMAPLIASFEKLLDLAGRARAIAGGAKGLINIANGQERDLKSAKERAEGKDGVLPGAGGSSAMPASTARSGAGVESIIDGLASGIRTAKGIASCGNFAAQLLDRLGYALPKDKDGVLARRLNVAKNFGDWASANGTEIDPAKAGAGDVIIWHGQKYGALKFAGGGYHVGVGSGNGRVWDSSGNGPGHQRERNISDLAHAKAYRLNQSGNLPSAPASSGTTAAAIKAQAEQLGKLFDTDPNAMGQSKLDEILAGGFDGSIGKIEAVNKAWGKAVKDVEGNSVRFALQTKLSTKEFNDDIEFMSRITGRSVPEIIAWLRKFANAADFKLNAEEKKAELKTLAEEAKKVRWSIQDDAAAGERAGMDRAELLAYEGNLIAQGTLDEQGRSDALEIEIARRARINDLLEKGADLAAATNIAAKEAATETANIAAQRANERSAAKDNALWSVGLEEVPKTGLRELVDGVLPQLRDALEDTTISGEDLAKILSGVPLPLLQMERNARAATGALDALPGRYRELLRLLDALRARSSTAEAKDRVSPFLADAEAAANDATAALLEQGAKGLDPVQLLQNKASIALQNIEAMKEAFKEDAAALAEIEKLGEKTATYYTTAIDAAKALQATQSGIKVDEFLGDLKREESLSRIFDPLQAELERIRQGLKRDKWTDAEIAQVLPAQEIFLKAEWLRGRIHDAAGGIYDALLNSIDGVREKGLSSLGDFADGVLNQLNHLAAQIIANKLWSGINGLFGNLLGGLFGGGVGKATPGILSFGDAAKIVDGSHANGLASVPFDGYIAELHKGETVVPAKQSAAFRDAMLSRSPSGGAASAGGVNITTIYHVEKVVANDTKRFTDSLPGSPASDISEAQAARKVAQIAQKGNKHL